MNCPYPKFQGGAGAEQIDFLYPEFRLLNIRLNSQLSTLNYFLPPIAIDRYSRLKFPQPDRDRLASSASTGQL
jgi:hypothetical protein